MNITRTIVAASIAGLLAAAPFGFAQGATTHDHSQGASAAKAKPKLVKKRPAQHGHMRLGMKGRTMQGGGQAGQMGHAGKMQCPMMSAGASSSMHSPRMQWHHNMMMWHHQMMHGQSPAQRGG